MQQSVMYMLNIALNAASLSLILIISCSYLMRRCYRTLSYKVFMVLLLVNGYSALTDIVVGMESHYKASYRVLYFHGGSNTLARFMVAVLIMLYSIVYVRERRARKYETAMLVVLTTAFFGLVVTSPITHWVYSFNSDKEFTQGPLMPVLLLMELFAISYSIMTIAINTRRLTRYQIVGIVSNVIIVAIGYSFSYIFAGLHTQSMTISLTLLVARLVLESPSDFLFMNTYFYNDKACQETIRQKMDRKMNFKFVVFSVENFNYVRQFLGASGRREITTTLMNYLRSKYPRETTYYLGEHRFAVFTSLHAPEIEGIIADTEHFFEHDFRLPGMDIAMTPFFVTFNYEDFDGSPEDIFECVLYPFSAREEFAGSHVVAANTEMMKHKRREEEVRHAIRKALKAGGFEVYYQPIFQGGEKRFVTAEALLRLNDSKLGNIRPDEFIPIAEKFGMIVEVGEFVFESVCRFWNANKLETRGIQFIEVNLSMVQCMQENLASRLRTIMASHDINPKYINLEITETAAAMKETVMIQNMKDLSCVGVGFSLDDYGTGFSTASRLTELPVGIVKLDKSILWDAMKNESALAILRNTIHMLKDLEKLCVVEGVETSEMAVTLRNLGCDYYQGYLFSKPIPGDEFLKFLQNNEFTGTDKAFRVA